MYRVNTSLLVTGQDCTDLDKMIQICKRNNVVLSKIFNMCDAISAINEYRYQTLIFDAKYFESNINLLVLFKRKEYYIPNIIILSDHKTFDCSLPDSYVVNRTDLLEFERVIKKCNTEIFTDMSFSPFITTIIESQMVKLGFSRKYKGFDYIVALIERLFKNHDLKKSFSKYLYPYISVLYHVSTGSVERDIRNSINKNKNLDKLRQICESQNAKCSTKNIINALWLSLQDEFSKRNNPSIY